MKKTIITLMLFVGLIYVSMNFSGCASSCQRMKANGSVIGTQSGDWIVLKQSGGRITDCYLLTNVFVQSEEGSDGWLFIDQNGNPVHIGGDMKAIRVTSNKEEFFSKYVEYHMEFDTMTYQQKLNMKR